VPIQTSKRTLKGISRTFMSDQVRAGQRVVVSLLQSNESLLSLGSISSCKHRYHREYVFKRFVLILSCKSYFLISWIKWFQNNRVSVIVASMNNVTCIKKITKNHKSTIGLIFFKWTSYSAFPGKKNCHYV
jgi:hypothetical protein